ncbi:MAG: 3-isopropylmalate dehydratase small subunit [Candidatus Tectomicrobia bacterium]|nr:3-isopropylmalate dehydratase small subunit [Candidatus Tectomicrobia bacterium]
MSAVADALEGNAWTLGDHVDTDVIIPARHLITFDPEKLAPHCFEGVDPALASRIRPGDIVVAGHNFGCGSSREHAPIAIKALGVGCVIARSFGQIFYRNAFNRGLPLLEADLPPGAVRAGDRLSVALATGRIENRTTGAAFDAAPIPAFMRELIAAGGLIPFVLNRRA